MHATILHVEDDVDIALLVQVVLQTQGHAVDHLDPSTVDEVLAAVRSGRYDAVLLDVLLRDGVSGLDVLERIAADETLADVPVVIVSAHAEHDPRFGPLSPPDAHVRKPFEVTALMDAVQSALEGRASGVRRPPRGASPSLG